MILNEQREILFRGKPKYCNLNWTYGHWIRDEYATKIYDVDGLCLVIYPRTLGQYTGFTDCEGTKIFEHDIIRYDSTDRFDITNSYIGVVVMEAGTWCVKNNSADSVPISLYSIRINQSITLFEVIGNVFDNYELLEGRT